MSRLRPQGIPLAALLLAATVLGSLSFLPADASHLGETPLINSSASDIQAEVSGNKLVYAANPAGKWDIFHKDLTTGVTTQLTSDNNEQGNPEIDGNLVAWEHFVNPGTPNEQSHIYARSMSTGVTRQLTSGTMARAPSVSGNRIAFHDEAADGNYDIFVHDFSTNVTTPVVTETSDQVYPDVRGTRVVWADIRFLTLDIFMKDLSSGVESPVVIAPGHQQLPTSWGDKVVWQDNRSGNWDVYMKNLTTGVESVIASTSLDEQFPQIRGTFVLWNSYNPATTGWDVWSKELISGVTAHVVNRTGDQTNQSFAGKRAVWDDARDGTWDIYSGTLRCYDVSGDLLVNVVDLSQISQHLGETPASPNWDPKYDLNKDNAINVVDLSLGGTQVGASCP